MRATRNTLFGRALDRIVHRLAAKLNAPGSGCKRFTPSDTETLCRVVQPGDALLVEGAGEVSAAGG